MSRRARALAAAACALWLAPGCGRFGLAAEPEPVAVLSRTEPFALTELLAEAFASSGSDRVELTFEALDAGGEPLPFALLDFAWDEGGDTAFQTDEHGLLRVRFDAGVPMGEATVWVQILPIGHAFASFAAERADIWRPLASGELRIAVLPGA